MKVIRVLPQAAALMLISTTAFAGSCVIRASGSDAPLKQCHDYGPLLSAKSVQKKLGSATLGEAACKATNNKKTDSGIIAYTQYRDEKCPTENVTLRCGLLGSNDEFQLTINYYDLPSMRAMLATVCEAAEGKIVE